MKKIFFFIALAALLSLSSLSQVSISTNGSPANSSAMLDVKSANKGLLIPQVALTGVNDSTTIATPATSLLVYNAATATGITPGYYYNSGTSGSPVWVRFTTINIDGSETIVTSGTNVTVTGAGTSASPYVVNAAPTHFVGELYGGGVVFWVDHTGQHGLIVSMIDLSTSQAWSNVMGSLIGPTAQSDWNGLENSNAVIGQVGHSTSAAKLCLDYTNTNYGTGVFSDWYLPARGDINHLWNNIYEVQKILDSDSNPATTAMTKNWYWSSSEFDLNSAWAFSFAWGQTYPQGGKTALWYVRAVRTF